MAKQFHVVCFGAHPDDSEIFAGGLLLALKAAGAHITIVIGTDGSLSGGYPANHDLAKTRIAEATAGAALLGADLDMLGYPDGYLSLQSEAMGVINERLERYNPDLVLTHHPNDMHRDHREMSRLVTARVDPAHNLAYFEPAHGLIAQPNVLVDTTAHWPAKAAAIKVHVSQRAEEDILPGIEIWNRFRGLQMSRRSVQFAEGYIIGGSAFADPMRVLERAGKTKRM